MALAYVCLLSQVIVLNSFLLDGSLDLPDLPHQVALLLLQLVHLCLERHRGNQLLLFLTQILSDLEGTFSSVSWSR